MNVEARARRFRCPSCGADYRGVSGRCPFDASVLEELEDGLVGMTLGGYEVQELIGSGAGSTVYAARRASDGGSAPCALKVLRPELAEDAAHRARFLREARATMRVAHDGIVRVLATSADDAVPVFMAMERLHGRSLDRRIEEGGAIAASDAGRIAARIAAALTAAHRAGIVHRDVKPANVVLEDAGRVVVVDFGLACAAGEVGVTSTGELIGTPHYMAPEQILGRSPGPAVDAYALGCVVFAMVRGAPPFGGTTGAVLDAHLEVAAPGLGSGDPSLDALVTSLLAKQPTERMGPFAALAAQGSAS